MAEEVGLSTLDLVSKLTGYISLGCSIWYAIPQIFLNWVEKPPKNGPSFTLLITWLLGDIAQTTALFFENTLFTQKFAGIWFGATDIVIMWQLAVYRGWWCWGRRRKERKDGTLLKNHEKRRQARMKERIGIRAKVRDILASPWANFDGTRLNSIMFALIASASLVAWITADFLPRETATPPKATNRPHDDRGWAGWYTGIAGLLFYQVPRGWQIYKIVRNKSMEAISIWLYAFLVGQNTMLIVSILTVNHEPDSLFGQAPFISNTVIALFCDIIVLILRPRYSKKPSLDDTTADNLNEAGPPAVISVPRLASIAASTSSISSFHRSQPSSSSLSSRRPSTRPSSTRGDGRTRHDEARSSPSTSQNAPRPSRRGSTFSSSSEAKSGAVMAHSDEELEWARIHSHLARNGSGRSSKSAHSRTTGGTDDFSDRVMSLEKRDRRRRLPSFSSSDSDDFSEAGSGASSDEEAHLPLHPRSHPLGTHPYNPRRGVGTRWT